MMKCLIRQPAGLGDIIFCLKIGWKFAEQYDEVVWPLSPHYSWLQKYIELPSNLNMGLTTENEFLGKSRYISKHQAPFFSSQGFYYYPLELASLNYPGELIMTSKYRMAFLEWEDWKDYFMIIRNHEKEAELLASFPEEFNLICDVFASPPDVRKINISVPNNGFENKYVEFKEGFTPFDWMGVIEKAKTLLLEEMKN